MTPTLPSAPRPSRRARKTRLSTLLAFTLVSMTFSTVATAQPARTRTVKPRSKTELRTEVRVELITDRRGAPLAAQRWAMTFQRFQVPLRIRRAIGVERTSVRETITGGLRQVKVIGLLDRSGRILVPGKSFSPGNPAALGQWLNELGTFGAKGNPSGQPAFGLSEGQFNNLFETFSQPVSNDLAGNTLEQAVRSLKLPNTLTLDLARLGPAAKQIVPLRTNGPGLSRGTTLATLLATAGLAFQPRRTPAGQVELLITRTTEGTKTWPVGWPPRLSRIKTARPLFQIVPVELNNASFLEVLDTIAAKTKIPMLIDHHGLAKNNIKPGSLTVTVKPKKAAWFQLQKSVTNPHHLTRDLRIDEAGKPFVLVTPITNKPVSKK